MKLILEKQFRDKALTGYGFGKVLCLLLFMMALSSCESSTPSGNDSVQDSSFKVIDTGYWNASSRASPEPLWLDNQHIIFTSTKSLHPEATPLKVKILNVETGKVTPTEYDAIICARSGVAMYATEISFENWNYFRGSFLSEKPYSAPGQNMRVEANIRCDWTSNASLKKMELLGESYLESFDDRHAIFYRKPGEPGLVLPSNENISEVVYSEYLDTYLLRMAFTAPRTHDVVAFWTLSRKGEIKKIQFSKKLPKGRFEPYLVKSGYLASYQADPLPGSDRFSSALYLVRDNKVVRLAGGSILGLHVSPDGCRVAFSHAENIKDRFGPALPKNTIKLINVCQGDQSL